MKIKVNRKNLLEAAELCAKLVIPSRSPIEAMPNLRLTASTKLHTTELLASNGEETAVASVFDSHPDSDCDTMVNCAALTAFLKSFDSDYVTLDIHDGKLDIYTKDSLVGTVTASNAAGGPVAPLVPKDAAGFILPSNFTKLLKTAFKYVAPTAEKHLAITGVNLSCYGVTATDGHVLYHVPVPMRIKGNITLPKPVLPPSFTGMPLTMKTWEENRYEIKGIGFALYGRGMNAVYPDWNRILPEQSAYLGRFTLKGDMTDLKGFLKKTPNQEVIVTVNDKSLLVKSWEGEFEVPADTSCRHGSVLRMIGDNLLSAIELGHTEVRFGDKKKVPFMATGGTGFFLFTWMKEDAAAVGKTDAGNTSDETTINNKTDTVSSRTNEGTTAADNQTNTRQEKEKDNMENRTMTQTTAITRFPVTPQTQTQAPQQVAFDELEQLFNDLKETQAMFNEQIANISRKLKAAVTADRQLTREYNKAIGRLEAVRKAI